MVIVNRKWPRVTSWILLWSFLSLSLSFYLSLPVFNSEVSLDPSWRNGIRDERSVRLRRLSLSPLRADQTGRLLEIDGIARMTGKVSVQCRKKSKSFERVGEKGEGEIGWRRNRGEGECISKVLEMESWRRLVDSLEEETFVYLYVCGNTRNRMDGFDRSHKIE